MTKLPMTTQIIDILDSFYDISDGDEALDKMKTVLGLIIGPDFGAFLQVSTPTSPLAYLYNLGIFGAVDMYKYGEYSGIGVPDNNNFLEVFQEVVVNSVNTEKISKEIDKLSNESLKTIEDRWPFVMLASLFSEGELLKTQSITLLGAQFYRNHLIRKYNAAEREEGSDSIGTEE
jgi:hypothetical protein